MSIQTDARDGSKLTVRHGLRRQVHAAAGSARSGRRTSRPSRPSACRDGRFSADLTGTARNLGGVKGRTGEFRWKLTGRFTDARRRPRDRQRQRRDRDAAGASSRAARSPSRPPCGSRSAAAEGAKFSGRAPIEGMSDTATLLLVEDDPVDPDVPRRQPHRRRLRAAGRRDARGRAARARVQAPGPRGRRPQAARRLGPRAGPARAGGGRHRLAAGPDAAARRALRLAASELDRVRGFERGADDYVAKPFAYGELRLRIAAVLRRSQARVQRGLLRVGELEIDPAGARDDGCAGSGSSSRRRSSRCCGRSPRRRRACSRRRSCCATSGASGRSARRARWTPTPAGCAQKLRVAGRRVRRQRLGRRLPAGRRPDRERGAHDLSSLCELGR